MSNSEKTKRPEILSIARQERLTFSTEAGGMVMKAYKSIEEIPVSEDFIDIAEFKKELGEESLSILLEALDQPPEFEDPIELFKRNLSAIPKDVPEREFALAFYENEVRAAKIQAENSFTFALANTVQIWQIGEMLAVVKTEKGGPELIAAAPLDSQDAKLAWSLGFGTELLLGILGILGVPKLNSTGVSKMLHKILANPELAKLFSRLTIKLTAAELIIFITLLYEKGLLGDLVKEAMTGVSFAAILILITTIAAKFFSGGTLLAIHAGILAVELGYKLSKKPA